MPPYVATSVGLPISDLEINDGGQDEAMMSLQRGNVAPVDGKPVGVQWQCTDASTLTAAGTPSGQTEAVLRWNGSAWTYWFASTKLLSADGRVALTGAFNAGSQQIFNVAAGSSSDHAVRMDQVLLRSGANAATGNLNMASNRIRNLVAPVNADEPLRLADAGAFSNFTHRTNRSGTNPLVIQLQSNQAATFCPLGFIPRKVRVRISGRLWNQGTNTGDSTGTIDAPFEIELFRWQDDSAGGDSGTAAIAMVRIPDSVRSFNVWAGTLTLVLQWRDDADPANRGFFLRLRKAAGSVPADSGDWLTVRNASNTSVEGVVQVMAWG
jgi:hypothetical protein